MRGMSIQSRPPSGGSVWAVAMEGRAARQLRFRPQHSPIHSHEGRAAESSRLMIMRRVPIGGCPLNKRATFIAPSFQPADDLAQSVQGSIVAATTTSS
uniref:Uncharacterized protein n=1 Tax=Plectus sambesii TaxID=2011161 RepID=A0A914VC67_9BILA